MLELSVQKEIVDEYTLNPKAVMSSLAKKYGCSPATIREILIRNGVPENVRKSKRKIPEPQGGASRRNLKGGLRNTI
jgi:transposase-like protein